MESQDGITVRPMRLKVLYTFDDASKTNCLARWPHLLEIESAALDEKTQVGVIELKTCIQAIVSASPELVAQLGQDYTVYAYDYSEFDTPLVGQGMLSWLLASASPTPNTPAQTKTMVTGRVCKNVLGLFSKGAQETLEVKLRLVPVPSVMQSDFLDNIQKYREIGNSAPRDFDTQSWNSFHRQNSNMSGRVSSPMDHTGIERFHQLLSEGSTPREFPMATNASYRSVSPAQSAVAPMSRVSTPFGQQHQSFQHDQQPTQQTERMQGDMIRPSSSASMRDADFAAHARYASRRGSVQSGYGSCDEPADSQPRKRAKLYRADGPGKPELNIERQPSSLRVAASTAASVRIHRPTPINPSIAAAQNSNEEPVRPPTPISGANDLPRRYRPPPSLLRESSVQSMSQYTSPYPTSDDHNPMEQPGHSPEESRYQGLFEPSFSMPSSPPVLDCGFPNRSSPVLPPMTTDPDSGFMSGGIEELMDEDMGTPLDECGPSASKNRPKQKRTVRQAVQASSPASAPPNVETPNENGLVSGGNPENSQKDVSVLPRAPASVAGSRPSSRASFRQAPKPLAPAPISQSELEQLISAIPASDPVMPSNNNQGQNPQPWSGPMSDLPTAETPSAQPVAAEDRKIRSGAGARRLKQVQARLDKCIRDGQAPPFCENCGVIETPTWRRAWSKEIEGTEQEANELTKDPAVFFWQSLERDDQDKVTKFKIYKKSLVDADNDFVQVLLCNPCGLWLHKFKCMRPENKWNKSSNNKRKRPPRNRKTGGPLSTNGTATRSRKTDSAKVDGSSPGASDASTPANEDPATPRAEDGSSKKPSGNEENSQENNDDVEELPSKRRRATSLEPRKSSDTSGNRWQEPNAMDALRRAIQSSPARNAESRNAAALGEKTLTPKPVRRVLFPNSQNEGGPLKALGESVLNSPRRSPRIASRESDKRPQDKENGGGRGNADLDGLFESPSFDFDLPTSPTPRRRNPRAGVLSEKRLSLPYNSPSSSKARKDLGSDLSPTKLTAQRLQRIQSSPASSTRQGRTPKQSRSQMPDLSSMSDDAFGTEAFGGMSNIVDIFSEDASAAHTGSLFPGSNWTDWLPSDYVSPAGSDEDQNADLISAILSDSGMGKENIDSSQFDIFDYADSNLLDSGFFGSDALNADLMALGVKSKPSAEESTDKEQSSSANNAS